MNTQTSISVCIGMPIFNGAKFLRRSLDSLLAQSYKKFHLVISNNASTDKTEEICTEYSKRDQRISYRSQACNIGAFQNFQYTFDQSDGKYFMWAACDDVWEPAFLESCVDALDSNRDVSLAFTRYKTDSELFGFAAGGRRCGSLEFICDPDTFIRVKNFILLPENSQKANFIYGLWRRELLGQVLTVFEPHLNESSGSGVDIAMLVYALTKSRFLQIPEYLFSKRYIRAAPGSPMSVMQAWLGKLPGIGSFASRRDRKGLERHLELLQFSLLEVMQQQNISWDEVLKEKRRNLLS